MIAVDTSALIAIVRREAEAEACSRALLAQDAVVISAATLAEALIVASRRDLGSQMISLIEGIQCVVDPVTEASARNVAEAYDRWGKGVHPARLNLGDCFAYEMASRLACPLLYVGDDFSKTDITSAL